MYRPHKRVKSSALLHTQGLQPHSATHQERFSQTPHGMPPNHQSAISQDHTRVQIHQKNTGHDAQDIAHGKARVPHLKRCVERRDQSLGQCCSLRKTDPGWSWSLLLS